MSFLCYYASAAAQQTICGSSRRSFHTIIGRYPLDLTWLRTLDLKTQQDVNQHIELKRKMPRVLSGHFQVRWSWPLFLSLGANVGSFGFMRWGRLRGAGQHVHGAGGRRLPAQNHDTDVSNAPKREDFTFYLLESVKKVLLDVCTGYMSGKWVNPVFPVCVCLSALVRPHPDSLVSGCTCHSQMCRWSLNQEIKQSISELKH